MEGNGTIIQYKKYIPNLNLQRSSAPRMQNLTNNVEATTEETNYIWPISLANPNDSDFQSCINVQTESEKFYRFVTCGLCINIVGILGILGNIISMVILSRPQMRSSINYLLMGLARIDTLLIITSVLLFGFPGIYPYSGLMFNYYYVVYAHLTPVIYPLATMCQTASVYLTLTISLERFVAVCFPLRARSLCTYGRARIYVLGIVIFSVMYNLPRLFEGTVQKEWSERFNTTVYCPTMTTFRGNLEYKTIYVHWMYFVCMYLLPFASLAVLNTCIYRQVLKANRERQRLSRHQKREIGLATMLLCVVAVFFICNLLPLVINIIETFEIPIRFDLTYLIHASNLLVTINSSVNFIIYVIFGDKFQRIFLMLFCSSSMFGFNRDSTEGTVNDEISFMSNGDRHSTRRNRHSLSRNGTTNSRNGTLTSRLNGSGRASTRSRTSSPGPCIYYPLNTNKEHRASVKITGSCTAQTTL